MKLGCEMFEAEDHAEWGSCWCSASLMVIIMRPVVKKESNLAIGCVHVIIF
jgi:hypothetical protein